jgi:hypothetical protein
VSFPQRQKQTDNPGSEQKHGYNRKNRGFKGTKLPGSQHSETPALV